MTLTQAKAMVMSYGLVLSKRDGEYRVTVCTLDKGLAERIAYYTDDINDAVQTAKFMSQEPANSDFLR